MYQIQDNIWRTETRDRQWAGWQEARHVSVRHGMTRARFGTARSVPCRT